MKKSFAFLLLFFVSAAVLAQSPFDGTWKLNLSGSQFSPKPETFALQDGTYTCSTCETNINMKADGSDQKIAGSKAYDTLAVKQIDDKRVVLTEKKAGRITSELTYTASADGKSLQIAFADHSSQGPPVTGNVVLTRVAAGPAGSHAISGSWLMQKVENVSEQGLKMTLKGTVDGLQMTTPSGSSYDAKFDGKDYPIKGDQTGGTISLRKISDTTIEETYKQDGKPIVVNQISVNGKSMEYISKNLGRGTTSSLKFERQ